MLTTTQTQRTGTWLFGWLVAFIGFPLGGVLATLLVGSVDNALEGLIAGLAAGMVIGGAQWLALRRYHPVSRTWISATALGLGAGVGVSSLLFGTGTTLDVLLLRAAPTGLALGVAQWLVMRRWFAASTLWLVMTPLAFSIAWWLTAQVIGNSVNAGFVIFGSSGALVYQAWLGGVLWWWQRHQPEMDS